MLPLGGLLFVFLHAFPVHFTACVCSLSPCSVSPASLPWLMGNGSLPLSRGLYWVGQKVCFFFCKINGTFSFSPITFLIWTW